MLNAIKELAPEFGCTAFIFPDGEVSYYRGKQPDGMSKEALDTLLGAAVWTGTVHGPDIESTKGIIGPVTTISAFRGAVSVAIAERTLNGYFAAYGAYGIQEADDGYNDIARNIIQGMSLYYANPKLGFINIHSPDDRKAVVNGKKSPFFPVPETCYNFCADFVLPPETGENRRSYQELAGLIRYWNAGSEQREELLSSDLSWYASAAVRGTTAITPILNHIRALGGHSLHWS